MLFTIQVEFPRLKLSSYIDIMPHKYTKGTIVNIENVEIRKAKYPKGDDLQKGTASLTLKDIGMDIRNIPYRVTKEREIFVTVPCLVYSEQKEKGEKPENKLVPTISFHDSAIWDSIVEAIKKEISLD